MPMYILIEYSDNYSDTSGSLWNFKRMEFYTTGCLLDFASFEKNYRLIAIDLNKQKGLNADSRAIQQIILTGKIKATENNTRVIIYYILEKSKETMLEFSKGTTKAL